MAILGGHIPCEGVLNRTRQLAAVGALVTNASQTDTMKPALLFAAVFEAVFAAALLIVPSLVGLLLFGVPLTGMAIIVARMAGIALIGLAVACWSGTPLLGMLTYHATVMLYLAFVGIASGFSGILLWLAVVVHAIMTALLAREQREASLEKT
jgi:hypothetical protein